MTIDSGWREIEVVRYFSIGVARNHSRNDLQLVRGQSKFLLPRFDLIWIILHNGVRYEERGPTICEKAKRARTSRMIRTLRTLSYRVGPVGILV